MGKLIDLTGQRFGRLTVLERDTTRTSSHACWLCKCDCGKIKTVQSGDLLNGKVLSCGCYRRQVFRYETHGLRRSQTYSVWGGMLTRCFNPKAKSYPLYGGRGITVCDEWRNDFAAFYEHVSKLEHFGEEGYSLDRIDNERGYCPQNVRWATRTEQGRNRRDNRFVDVGNGRLMTLTDAAREAGVHVSTMRERIERGWTGAKLLEPAHRK